MPSQLLPVSRQCSNPSPKTNVAQDTQDHPTPAGRAVKNDIDTNKGGSWNSRSEQKSNLWCTDHTWAHGLPSSSSSCSSSGSSGSPVGRDTVLGLRHRRDPGSRCFFRCITHPLESSDFRTTAHHLLLLLKGTFLLRSDKIIHKHQTLPAVPAAEATKYCNPPGSPQFCMINSRMTWQNQK